MIKYESNCVGCTSIGLHCMGQGCPNHGKVPVPYCEHCGHEIDIDEVYEVDGEHLCEDCLKDMFRVEVEQ